MFAQFIMNGAGISPSLPPLPAPFFFYRQNDALRLSSLSNSYVKLPVMVNVCSKRSSFFTDFLSPWYYKCYGFTIFVVLRAIYHLGCSSVVVHLEIIPGQ